MQMNINDTNVILKGNFNNNVEVWQKLLQATSDANLNIVGMVKHDFYPIGLTGVVLLSESHIAIHTFPENDECWLNIATCTGSMDSINTFLEVISKYWHLDSLSA